MALVKKATLTRKHNSWFAVCYNSRRASKLNTIVTDRDKIMLRPQCELTINIDEHRVWFYNFYNK